MNNPFLPTFSFSNSSPSSSSPENGGFTFTSGVTDQTNERQRCFQGRKRTTARSSENNKTTPSCSVFKCPPIFEKVNEKDNSEEITNKNQMPENSKTRFALTGTFSCKFEGSSYSFRPPESSSFASDKSIKKEERDEESVQNTSTPSQIIASRLLKGIPQSPHFWPLRRYSKPAKQSLINAWDQIFEKTVDKIKNIRIDCFCIDAKILWETLQELQMMGYYVLPLRRRLVELSDVMLRKTRHERTKMSLKKKAEQHMIEKSRFEFEILMLKAKVEAEKVCFEDAMAKISKMDDEMPSFDACFSKLAIKQL
ncbi:unnamed protein product [Amaranthus hypochondriacus]